MLIASYKSTSGSAANCHHDSFNISIPWANLVLLMLWIIELMRVRIKHKKCFKSTEIMRFKETSMIVEVGKSKSRAKVKQVTGRIGAFVIY